MMEASGNTSVCPVCGLQLPSEVTLEYHMSSHPKDMIIKAFVRYHQPPKDNEYSIPSASHWNQNVTSAPQPGSSSSRSKLLNISPFTQEYMDIPSVFSALMFLPHNESTVRISEINEQQEEEGMIWKSSEQDEGETKKGVYEEKSHSDSTDNKSTGVHKDKEEEGSNSPHGSRAGSDSKACMHATFGKTSDNRSPPISPKAPDISNVEEAYSENGDISKEITVGDLMTDEIKPTRKELSGKGNSGGTKDNDNGQEDCNSYAELQYVSSDTYSRPLSSQASEFEYIEEDENFYGEITASDTMIDEGMPSRAELSGEESNGGTKDNDRGQEDCNSCVESHVSSDSYFRPPSSQGSEFECIIEEDEKVYREITLSDIMNNERMPSREELSGEKSNGGTVSDNGNDQDDCNSSVGSHAHSDSCYRPPSSQTSGFECVQDDEEVSTETEVVDIWVDKQMYARGKLSGEESNDESSDNGSGKENCNSSIESHVSSNSYSPPPSFQDSDYEYVEEDNGVSRGIVTGDDERMPARKELSGEESNGAPVCTQPALTTENMEVSNPSNAQDNKVKTRKTGLKLVCLICEAVFPSRNALYSHKRKIHKGVANIRHKCEICGEGFPNNNKFTEHLKIHPLECHVCGKLFYRKQNIKIHMKRHQDVRPYKCNVCEKTFVTKQKRDEHNYIHTGEAPIKCSLCDKRFRRHSNLIQHRNTHHFGKKRKVKDFFCECGEYFHSKERLAWHKETHEKKPKSCAHCSERFRHMASLTRHIRRAHNDRFVSNKKRSEENVQCRICKSVVLRTSLKAHICNHNGKKPFNCLICNKNFKTKWNLKLHKMVHVPRTKKPYTCDKCKDGFIRQADYIAHMNSHRGVKAYTCKYCGVKFTTKYNCLRHVKEHEKEKSFICQICEKRFHRSYYLKNHMTVHSGIRPYACDVCGKRFGTKWNRNKHVQSHERRESSSSESEIF